jgi:phage terminase small subunit
MTQQPPKPKKLELTQKQRSFVKGLAQGKTKKKAAEDAGYSPKSAQSQASENLRKPNVREVFLRAMDKAGITDEKLATVMSEGLEAKRAISAVVGNDATGKTMDFIDVPDHNARHRFFDSAAKIKGLEAPKEINAKVTGNLEDTLNQLDEGQTQGDPSEAS